MSILKNKTYVVISLWGYPFGGGEEFLYQSMKWAYYTGMKSYWLAFKNASGENYQKLMIEEHKYGTLIRVPDGFSEKSLTLWLKLLKPDIAHHQGHLRLQFYEVCHKLRIEFISGFHFWTGSIILHPNYKNIDILKNYEQHKPDPELNTLIPKKYCNLYTVTPFVSECINKITNHNITDHIYASSSYDAIKIPDLDVTKNKFITMINIHKLKGGELFLWLLKNCANLPFLGVKTEYHSEDLDNKIYEAINNRYENDKEMSMIIDRVDDPTFIYKNTRILIVPNLVDETFCRVVNEAMMNGIPVISTGQGNIKYLMGNSGYIIPFSNKKEWKDILEKLYFDNELLLKKSKESLKEYNNFSEEKAIELFNTFLTKIMIKSKENNVMIFSPWCDQGLGIQSRNYYKILKSHGFTVSVFAVKPYNANTCIELQKNPEEWYVENIYYSDNDRESVTDIEILNFIKKYNVGKCILPETCWFRVFEVAKLLKLNSVKCYAVPNIEIVRKDEIYKHKYFHKILCNNKLCQDIFSSYGNKNTEYVGYGVQNIYFKNKKYTDEVKFLFIGGMNAFSRKHILEICEGFVIAHKKLKNIKLTCTIQKINLLEKDKKDKINEYINHPAINIIETHLNYSDIINKYYESDVSIQVSKHEGLGLGFYEGLATGTPILTLNTPPHNEIIVNDVNGWIIDCYYKKMTDNKDPIFDSAYFEPKDLADCIIDIVENKKYISIIKKLILDYSNRLDIMVFSKKFIQALTN
jgi:glycosyltransferase involved in cell wall biosynthesis